MLAFLAWWLIIQLFGLAALPLMQRVCAWLPDRGYAFSKTAGLLLVSYLLWLGASAGILTNNAGGIFFALLLVAGLSAWLVIRANGWRGAFQPFHALWTENKSRILVGEALFLLAFAGWTLMRAYAPDKILPAGGEKYMEIAFLNGVLNSPHFPPLDPWLAGYGISYYYFGYVMLGVMVRFTGVTPFVGFDLYDALLFGLTALSAYGLVANLVAVSGGSRRAANGFGLLGALFVGGLGNLEGLLEGLYSSNLLPASFWAWLDIPDLLGNPTNGSFFPGMSWWWWRASRVLHDLDLNGKPIVFQPIDEFPFFSFLLGDNHPHKLGLPFVLLAAGLALNLLLYVSTRASLPGADRFWTWLRRIPLGLFLFYAVALGGLAFLNTWDFPIYLGLVMLAFGLGLWMKRSAPPGPYPAAEQSLAAAPEPGRSLGGILLWSLALGIAFGIAAVLLYVFFYLGFSSQAGGILPYVFLPTRLAQYLVMFGPFIFILAFLVSLSVRTERGHFAWRAALRTWAWIFALSYAAYLVVLLLGAGLLSLTGLHNSPLLQPYLNGMSLSQALERILLARLADPWLFLVLSALLALAVTGILLHNRANQTGQPPAAGLSFALLLAFLGLALTLTTEFFYLRDDFGVRMNTIFKFYFQGWVMMALASAYGVWWVSQHAGGWLRSVFIAGTALLIAGGLVYPVMGIISRDNGFQQAPQLSAAATFAGETINQWAAHPDDWAAVQWLRLHGRGANGSGPDGSVPIILEATGGGYENAGRISAFTGFPTLLGWTNHESQWRGNNSAIDQRSPVVSTIYTTSSASQALQLLQEWQVQYVIVGDTERQYVTKQCQAAQPPCDPAKALAKFAQFLTPVFQQGSTTVYRVPPSLPKENP